LPLSLYFELTVLDRDEGVPDAGRGGGGIVVGRSRSRGSGGGGIADVLAPNTPNDERFDEYGLFGADGPVDRLSPLAPAVDECA